MELMLQHGSRSPLRGQTHTVLRVDLLYWKTYLVVAGVTSAVTGGWIQVLLPRLLRSRTLVGSSRRSVLAPLCHISLAFWGTLRVGQSLSKATTRRTCRGPSCGTCWRTRGGTPPTRPTRRRSPKAVAWHLPTSFAALGVSVLGGPGPSPPRPKKHNEGQQEGRFPSKTTKQIQNRFARSGCNPLRFWGPGAL